MYKTNITDDYNDASSINKNFRNNDKNFEIIIPLFKKSHVGYHLCVYYPSWYTH